MSSPSRIKAYGQHVQCLRSVPCIACISFICGILFVVGHHLFYHSLAGKPATDDAYIFSGWRISKQQFDIAVGTTFSFLVRAFFGIAASAAYVQLLWYTIWTTDRKLTVKTIDNISSLNNNPLLLFDLKWGHFPALYAVATLVWLLPVASIAPPATLSVQIHRLEPQVYSNLSVPNIDWAGLKMFNEPDVFNQWSPVPDDSNMLYHYSGPSPGVAATAVSVGYNNISILSQPQDTIGQNASWSLAFAGPGLQCANIADSTSIKHDILNTTGSSVGLVSWRAGLATHGIISQTGVGTCVSPLTPPSVVAGGSNIPPGEDYEIPDTLPTYFIPNCYSPNNDVPLAFYFTLLTVNSTTTVECLMVNTTYRADFTAVNGKVDVDLTAEVSDPTPINAISPFVSSRKPVGPGCITTSGTDNLTAEVQTNSTSCLSPNQLLRRLSYQAAVDAFSSQYVGCSQGIARYTLDYPLSPVRSTLIGQRPEVQALMVDVDANITFKDVLQNTTSIKLDGIGNPVILSQNDTLAGAFESLFRTFPISLTSLTEVQPNASSPFAPPTVDVTILDSAAVYACSARKLWISYGCVIIATGIAMATGLFALIKNDASFNWNFSTILRVLRDVQLSGEVKDEDTYGQEPLPKYLAGTEVDFPGRRGHGVTRYRGNLAQDDDQEANVAHELRILVKNP